MFFIRFGQQEASSQWVCVTPEELQVDIHLHFPTGFGKPMTRKAKAFVFILPLSQIVPVILSVANAKSKSVTWRSPEILDLLKIETTNPGNDCLVWGQDQSL